MASLTAEVLGSGIGERDKAWEFTLPRIFESSAAAMRGVRKEAVTSRHPYSSKRTIGGFRILCRGYWESSKFPARLWNFAPFCLGWASDAAPNEHP